MLGVHPRSRGEYGLLSVLLSRYSGSSPLTRGIHRLILQTDCLPRFIPAHAGNTTGKQVKTCFFWVHPRSRGEYCSPAINSWSITGSSPLTRGIHRRTHKAIKKVWFIPAHAGNTRLSGKWAHRAEVHPRSRGEYFG